MLIVTEWIREALRNPNSGINPFGGYTQGFKAGLFIKKMMQFRGQIGPPKRGFSAKNYFSPEKKNKYCPKCIKKDDDHQVKSMVNLVDDIAANALKSMVAGEELDTAAPLGDHPPPSPPLIIIVVLLIITFMLLMTIPVKNDQL